MKKNLKKLTVVLLILISFNNFVLSQVVISENSGATPDISSMLDIQSNSKGLLIPRLTTAERNGISNPAEGLLVYDSELKSFFIFGKTAKGTVDWYNISDASGIWSRSNNNVYLSSSEYNVGIGTSSPSRKFVIQAKNDNDTLFLIQDVDGNPLMVITPKLTKFNFIEGAKGVSGGFAVGRYATAKGSKAYNDSALLVVTPDSTRVYTSGSAVTSGGFAVGRYATAKGKAPYVKKYFFTGIDSTRVYTDGSGAKGVSGGFAVGRYATAKGNSGNYMYMIPDNYFIGHDAGAALQNSTYTGKYNTFFGYQSGYADTVGSNNIFIGYQSGLTNTDGSNNVLLGNESGYHITIANNNVFLGNGSGRSVTDEENNVFIGNNAGRGSVLGENNVFLGNSAGIANEGTDNVLLGNGAGANTTGSYNINIGNNAGGENEGERNILIGYFSGFGSKGSDNVFMGQYSGQYQTTGSNNIYLGNSAGEGQSWSVPNKGVENIFIGTSSGASTTEGKYNVFLGFETGMNTLGSSGWYYGNHNLFLGYHAGLSNIYGYKNVLIGFEAGLSLEGNGYSDMGSNNVFIGAGAGKNTTGSVANIAIGNDAGAEGGFLNTFVGLRSGNKQTGWRNAFFGYNAGQNSTDGDGNICFGARAGEYLSDGSYNILIGQEAGLYGSYSTHSIAIGYQTGYTMRGNYNVLIGDQAGNSMSYGDGGNVMIGYQAGYNETGSNKLYIDNSSTTSPLIYGDFSTNRVGINTSAPYTKLHIIGGADASLTSHGFFVTGAITGSNIVIDNNEIMARNNGSTSSLYIQWDGGNTNFGGGLYPKSHKVYDLGSSTLAWDDLYYDQAHNMKANSYANKDLHIEIVNFKLLNQKGSINVLEIGSLPDDLHDENSILTNEVSIYNYKLNYEQQVIINNQQKEIENLKEQNKKIQDLEQQIQELKELIQNK